MLSYSLYMQKSLVYSGDLCSNPWFGIECQPLAWLPGYGYTAQEADDHPSWDGIRSKRLIDTIFLWGFPKPCTRLGTVNGLWLCGVDSISNERAVSLNHKVEEVRPKP